ncbi:MAG: PEP-CTERM sorting domain-containing protein [Thermoguttaceae bacterium]|nr:PEP-CTERM sorting domain-containing protein [Thermoguttaceae bacterium]
MNARTFLSFSFAVLSLTFLAVSSAQARDFDTSDGDVINAETFSGSEDMNVYGGHVLYLGGTGSGAFTGNWYVSSGTTLATDNIATNKEAGGDDVLGSGKIYLTDATLMMWNHPERTTGSDWQRGVSNDVVISGNCNFVGSTGATELFLHGNLSGSGKITESMGYSFRIRGDNSAYTGNWDLNTDWCWVQNGQTDSTKAFGTGAVKLSSSGLGHSNGFVMNNDLEIGTSQANTFQGGGTLTLAGKLTGAGNITMKTISGGTSGSTAIKAYGDATGYTGNWYVQGTQAEDGTINWRTIETNNVGTTKEEVDSRLGSGKLYLNCTQLQASETGCRISNDMVVSGPVNIGIGNMELNLCGNISGETGTIYRQGGWSVYLRGDNSEYKGDWELKGDWTWATVSTESGPDKNFGSGTVTLNGGSIALSNTNTTLTANLNLQAYVGGHLVPFKGGSTVTLAGKLTGSLDFQTVAPNETGTPGKYIITGDGSEYTGNWHIGPNKTLSSDNINTSSTGIDPRFGSGIIYLEGGSLDSTAPSGRAYIYNDIVVSEDSKITCTTREISLNGNISGTGNLTRMTGGYTCYLTGDNSAFEGDWHLQADYICISNTDGAPGTLGTGDRSFGSGTVYIESGGIRLAGSSFVGYIDANLNVPAGKTGDLRYGNYVLRGDVNVLGTLTSGLDTPTMKLSGEDALLHGTGNVKVVTTMESGSTITPADLGTTGTLTVTDLTFKDGSQLVIDVNSAEDYDVLNVSNALLFEEGSQINVIVNGNLEELVGKELAVVTSTNSIPDLTQFLGDSTRAIFSDSYMSGTSLVLKAASMSNSVPEPATWLLLLLGIGFCFRKSVRKV